MAELKDGRLSMKRVVLAWTSAAANGLNAPEITGLSGESRFNDHERFRTARTE